MSDIKNPFVREACVKPVPIISVVRPADEPCIQVQLVNQVLPKEPENYFIVGQKLKQCECGGETATEQWSVSILTPVARKIMTPLEDIRIPPVSKPQFKQVDGCSYELRILFMRYSQPFTLSMVGVSS
jgi:hypothetical protein